MKRFSSILSLVTAVLTIGLVIGQGTAGFLRFLGENDRQVQVFEREMLQTKRHIARSLELPVWNFDGDQVSRLCRESIENPYVAGIAVYSAKGGFFSGIYKTSGNELVEAATADDIPPAFGKWREEIRQEDLFYEGNVLGRVSVFFTNQLGQATVRSEVSNIIRDSLLITGLLLVILMVSLRAFILLPLAKLNASVIYFGKRTYRDFDAATEGNEIQSLSRNFQMMEDRISRHEEALHHQLYTEQVTHLPNRNKLLSDLEVSINPVLFLLNLSSFKEINEFYGNQVGDQVLIAVGKRLEMQEIPGESMLYKMPADEYVFLYDREVFPLEEIRKEADRILRELESHPALIGEHTIYTSATIGIALMENRTVERGELFIRSDMALKKAQIRQEPYLIYDESLDMVRDLENNIIWSKKLNEAVRFGRVILFYQPIVNNQTLKVEKFECLIRVKEEDGKIHSPYYFLGVAKKTRLYPYLTRTVVQRAFEAFAGTEWEFSINISIDDILNKETNALIMQHLERNPETARRAVFEILESEGIDNYSAVKAFIDAVKAYGCKIAIDDFGSGYSNFGHVLKLDVNYIKIDAALIKNIHHDRNSQVVTRTIQSFAKELGIKTIAEFVSSPEILETLLGLGIDYSQGYYFGEPKESLPT